MWYVRSMRWGALLACTVVCGCGSNENDDTSADCQKVRDQICEEAAARGEGPNPCADASPAFQVACEKLREECGIALLAPTCP